MKKAQLLTEAGVTLEDARRRIAKGVAVGTLGPEALDVSGQSEVLYLRSRVTSLKKFAWRKRDWKPMDVLVENETGRIFFDTGSSDDPSFKPLHGGWARDWCAICNWELSTERAEHSTGYTHGRQWICTRCYDAFFDLGVRT